MNLDLSIVADEAEFAELIREKTDLRPGRAYHFGQRFLADSDANGGSADCSLPRGLSDYPWRSAAFSRPSDSAQAVATAEFGSVLPGIGPTAFFDELALVP